MYIPARAKPRLSARDFPLITVHRTLGVSQKNACRGQTNSRTNCAFIIITWKIQQGGFWHMVKRTNTQATHFSWRLNYKTDEFDFKTVSDMKKHSSKGQRGNSIYYGAIDFCKVLLSLLLSLTAVSHKSCTPLHQKNKYRRA